MEMALRVFEAHPKVRECRASSVCCVAVCLVTRYIHCADLARKARLDVDGLAVWARFSREDILTFCLDKLNAGDLLSSVLSVEVERAEVSGRSLYLTW